MVDWITEHWAEIGSAVALVAAAARIIVKLTPTPKDDAFLAKVLSVFKFIGWVDEPAKK